MTPRARRPIDLYEFTEPERLLAVALATGEDLTATEEKSIHDLCAKLDVSPAELRLHTLTRLLTPAERDVCKQRAEYDRQRLLKAHVLDVYNVTLAMRLASPELWLATDAELGAPERVSAEMVKYNLSGIVRVLGSRVRLQVTFMFAPVKHLFWRETDTGPR